MSQTYKLAPLVPSGFIILEFSVAELSVDQVLSVKSLLFKAKLVLCGSNNKCPLVLFRKSILGSSTPTVSIKPSLFTTVAVDALSKLNGSGLKLLFSSL